MNVRLLGTIWLATLAGCSTVVPGTPSHIRLDHNDVSFYQYRFEEEPGVWKNATCGYLIQGNSHSWQVPRSEWVISVYEVMDSNTPVVRVELAAFRVVSNDRKVAVERRPPITALTFTLKDQGNPLTATIIGQPARLSDEINATLETALAQELFKAFYRGEPVEISLTYQDGATEVLEVRNWYVASAPFVIDDGPPAVASPIGDYFHECLSSLHPAPAGVRYTIDELGPLPGVDYHQPGPIDWWGPPGTFCFGPHGEPGRCGAPEQGETRRPRSDLSPQ